MIKEDICSALGSSLKNLNISVGDSALVLERPNNIEHGDWASNAAMVYAKQINKPPRELAEALVEELETQNITYLDKIEIAGPGFLNFYLKETWLAELLSEIIDEGIENYGRGRLAGRSNDSSGEAPDKSQTKKQGKKTSPKAIVEFVSANPTGPLHAGHARGAVYGDALARVLERCGYDVACEFYINDLGAQMDLFAQSLIARKNGEEPPEEGYHGEYITEWAAEMPPEATSPKKGDEKEDPLQAARSWGLQKAKDDQEQVLKSLGITFDTWFSEASLSEKGGVDETLKQLQQKEAVYEKDNALWLRTTDYGDDKDRVLVRSDKSPTYILPDIAYHRNKLERVGELGKLINVWGADHHGYIKRLEAGLQALGEDPKKLKIVICQLVRLERNGEEVKLSKRSGDVIDLADVVEELGSDATRFTYLLQSIDSLQTVDLQAAAEQSMENPVYYVQYAYTRICSLFRRAEEANIKPDPKAEIAPIFDRPDNEKEKEMELMRLLGHLPDVVEQAAKDLAPHKITTYLREVASAFHGFYQECRIMGDDISDELTQARLRLITATQIVLKIGLDLCGVSAPEKM